MKLSWNEIKVKAHEALDKYVDSLYQKNAFVDDRERVEHLFGHYSKLLPTSA